MSAPNHQRLAQRNLRVPTLPQVAQRVMALAEDPDASAEELGQVVMTDAPIAMKVLKIANSAYYGLQEEVVSAERAASVLGFRVLRDIVLQASVIAEFDHLGGKAFDLDAQWIHSILTGRVCAFLRKRSTAPLDLSADELQMVGLLHDIGKVVLLDQEGPDYLDALREAHDTGRSLFRCERERFGFDHTDVGAILCARWSLPEPVARAVQFHHGPREKVRTDPLVCLVANVNLMLHRLLDRQDPDGARATFDSESAAIVGISSDDAAQAVEFAAAEAHEIRF